MKDHIFVFKTEIAKILICNNIIVQSVVNSNTHENSVRMYLPHLRPSMKHELS